MSKHQAPVEIESQEDARARVLTMVAEVCKDDSCPIQPVLDQCVSDAVTFRWQGTVKNYVPLLAFRDVQECIRLGYCPDLGEAT